jgi:prepilin signal peptidase PulO-like enzyme (type II secretory pathway)
MLDDIALLFKDNQLLFLSLIAVLGVCVGSFLNVVIYRVPIMLERRWTAISLRNNGEKANAFQDSFNLFLPRSHCPLCKKKSFYLTQYSDPQLFNFKREKRLLHPDNFFTVSTD